MMGFPLRRAIARSRKLRHARPLRPVGKIVPFPFLRTLRPGARRLASIQTAPLSFKSGPLELRLVETEADLSAVQELRYRVFYEEMTAKPTPEMEVRRRDFDSFDAHCDHLMVIDHGLKDEGPKVVGTYRLLRRSAAQRVGRFYTQDEYNIRKLLRSRSEVLELGRSCVDRDYRKQLTMNLLWRGIAHYVQQYDIRLMFGCASFPGTDPDVLAPQLSYLYYNHLAPPPLRPKALRSRYVAMDRLAPGKYDERRAKAMLPPLIKGYLRLGGYVGDGAVVDHQFDTTDVCIVVKTDLVTDRYYKHFTQSAHEAAPQQ